MENKLGFQIVGEDGITFRRHIQREEKKKSKRKTIEEYEQEQPKFEIPELLTGHVDIVQVRNGQIHLLDYKPNAKKEKPIEQLTWYALSLSRLAYDLENVASPMW